MSCTIDHLRADHHAEIIRDFTDARGTRHRAGEHGIIRRMDLDWPSQEIQIEWERDGVREILFFSMAAKTGPRNGAMREFFAVGEYSPLARPQQPAPAQVAAQVVEPSLPRRPERPPGSLSEFAGKHPPAGLCLHEIAVACDCDSAFHRNVLVEPRNIYVTACLRCGAVTCTKCVGDDGRFHGNAWHAYWTVDMPQPVVDWLARWPRVKVAYPNVRWPMESRLIRRDYLYYPPDARCESAAELAELESRLAGEQKGKTQAECLRTLNWPKTPPPPGTPDSLRDFVDMWEALRLRSESDLSTLAYFAQLSNQATPVASELLRQKADAYETMVKALRSNEEIWQSVGHAMARDSQPGDQRLAGVIIEILDSLSLEPLPDVPGRIVSCARFEALIVLVAELKLARPEMFAALKSHQRRLARHDAWLVKCIDVVLRELKGEPPLDHPQAAYLP